VKQPRYIAGAPIVPGGYCRWSVIDTEDKTMRKAPMAD